MDDVSNPMLHVASWYVAALPDLVASDLIYLHLQARGIDCSRQQVPC